MPESSKTITLINGSLFYFKFQKQKFMHLWDQLSIGHSNYNNRIISIVSLFFWDNLYRVYKKKRNLGISQEIDIVLKTKDFRRLRI